MNDVNKEQNKIKLKHIRQRINELVPSIKKSPVIKNEIIKIMNNTSGIADYIRNNENIDDKLEEFINTAVTEYNKTHDPKITVVTQF